MIAEQPEIGKGAPDIEPDSGDDVADKLIDTLKADSAHPEVPIATDQESPYQIPSKAQRIQDARETPHAQARLDAQDSGGGVSTYTAERGLLGPDAVGAAVPPIKEKGKGGSTKPVYGSRQRLVVDTPPETVADFQARNQEGSVLDLPDKEREVALESIKRARRILGHLDQDAPQDGQK
jgi:hypothetical protein